MAIKFYKPATDPYTSHNVNLWLQSTGENLVTATSSSEPTSGSVTVELTTPVRVTAGIPYIVSFNSPEGHFQYSNESTNPGTYPIRNGPLAAYSGCYLSGAGYPSNQDSYYYCVDLVFKTGNGALGFPDREGHYFYKRWRRHRSPRMIRMSGPRRRYGPRRRVFKMVELGRHVLPRPRE